MLFRFLFLLAIIGLSVGKYLKKINENFWQIFSKISTIVSGQNTENCPICCPVNETLGGCGNPCTESCQAQICPQYCVVGNNNCMCIPGYCRNSTGFCVQKPIQG